MMPAVAFDAARTRARALMWSLLVLSMAALPLGEGWALDNRFAAAERANYTALCRSRKDLDSCSDAVRWSPGDPVLVVALADALVRAKRWPEALRDYQRAKALNPNMRGLDVKISAAEARLTAPRVLRKAAADRTAGDKALARRYSNVDPEGISH